MDLILYAENRSSEIGSGNLKINFRCQKIKSIYKWKGEKKGGRCIIFQRAVHARSRKMTIRKHETAERWKKLFENEKWFENISNNATTTYSRRIGKGNIIRKCISMLKRCVVPTKKKVHTIVNHRRQSASHDPKKAHRKCCSRRKGHQQLF